MRTGAARWWGLVAVAALAVLLAVAARAGDAAPLDEAALLKKIAFPLAAFDAGGLVGPADGKRAQDYEFCIPAKPELAAQLQQLDPSVKLMKGSRGRSGCGKDTWLCIGNTAQKDWRAILLKLAALDYVAKINRCDWE